MHQATAVTVGVRGRRVMATVLLGAAFLILASLAPRVRPPLARGLGDHGRFHAIRGAFPLADGWLTLGMVAGSFCLLTGRRAALFWLLTGGDAGIYLFCMDVF